MMSGCRIAFSMVSEVLELNIIVKRNLKVQHMTQNGLLLTLLQPMTMSLYLLGGD